MSASNEVERSSGGSGNWLLFVSYPMMIASIALSESLVVSSLAPVAIGLLFIIVFVVMLTSSFSDSKQKPHRS